MIAVAATASTVRVISSMTVRFAFTINCQLPFKCWYCKFAGVAATATAECDCCHEIRCD